MSRLHAPFLAGLWVVASLSLAGCDMLVSGKDGSDAPVGPKLAQKPPPKPVDEVATVAGEMGEADTESEWTYNPIGLRDPFRSFLEDEGRPQGDVPVGPLQRFEVDQYQLVGIIWGIDRPRALVQDPERVGHVMEIGTYIGRNWGKITQITATEVVVTEEYQTIGGELVVNTIRMKLAGAEGTL